MIQRKKIDVDVIRDILKAAVAAIPENAFLKSLALQYEEKGGLSKKQLEGLHAKSLKIDTVPRHKLATLNAIIQQRPSRFKTEKPIAKPLFEKDNAKGEVISAILEKYPGHKRVLYFHAKYSRNEPLSTTESDELEKFRKLLLKP
jgi:hypothetical protein